MKPALSRGYLEPEHLIWLMGLCFMALLAVSALRMIFGPGLSFWLELIEVLPFMLMGGLCSEDMMANILSTATNAGFVVVTAAGLARIDHKLRNSFGVKHSLLRSTFSRPDETLWQARMARLRLTRSCS